jgi:hypothetical protein
MNLTKVCLSATMAFTIVTIMRAAINYCYYCVNGLWALCRAELTSIYSTVVLCFQGEESSQMLIA